MASKNTSDHIEEYIKQLLTQTGTAEIQRSRLADAFQVVPSQINYVIKTRFSESRGYAVESKRGGGGYIRIEKLTFSDQHLMLGNLSDRIGDSISEQIFNELLDYLLTEKILTKREELLLLCVTSDDLLGADAPQLRAKMLRKLLQRLDRKE